MNLLVSSLEISINLLTIISLIWELHALLGEFFSGLLDLSEQLMISFIAITQGK